MIFEAAKVCIEVVGLMLYLAVFLPFAVAVLVGNTVTGFFAVL